MAQEAKATAAKVGSVRVDRVNPKVLNESLAKVGEPTTGTIEERVARMATWIDERVKDEADLGGCNNCGATNDFAHMEGPNAVLPLRCAFCGDSEVEDVNASPSEAVANAQQKAFDTSGETVEETEMPAKKSNKKPSAKAEPPKSDPPKESQKVVHLRNRKKSATPEEAAALTTSEADLDAAIDRITQHKQEGAKNYVAICREVASIYEKGMWRARVDENGKPKFKDFDEFCKTELGSGEHQIYKQVAVAKVFTDDEIAKYGVTKLALALRVKDPDAARALLENNPSKRDIDKATRKASGEPTEDCYLGRLPKKLVKLQLYRRADTEKGKKKPAKRIADDPYGELQLEGGITLHFRVYSDARTGTLKLSFAARKGGDGAA